MGKCLERQMTGIRAFGPADVVDLNHLVYAPLAVGPEDIRILKLQPARSLSFTIHVTLSIAKLGDSSGQYDALSYQWGDYADKEMIIVNRKALQVSRSLATALRYLRHEDREVNLWADSICIDQSNNVEKNAQVALMGNIYSTAACVRIWLGEAGGNTAQAMHLVNDCNGFPDLDVVVRRVVGDQHGAIGLAELLRRPYWNRMWMFQEIVLSKVGHVHCGIFSAPFDTFVYMDLVSSRPQLWPDRKRSPSWIFDLRKAFFNITQFTIAPRELENLEHVLTVTRVLQASDPRDKLFALMGTCDMASYLTVDYEKTVWDVYTEFTRNHAHSTGKLSLALTAGWQNIVDETDDEELPSWTPDYRSSRPESDIYSGFAMAGVFDASKGRRFVRSDRSRVEPEVPAGVLETEGFILDTIKSISPLCAGDMGRRQILHDFDLQNLGDNPSEKPQLRALCEVLIFDADAVREADPDEVRACKKSRQAEILLGFMSDLETLNVNIPADKKDSPFDWDSLLGQSGTASLESVVSSYKQLKDSDPGTLEGYRDMFIKEYTLNAGKISTIFITRDNRIGRSNHTIQRGDIVAVLCGSDLPVILRNDGSCYKFLGGAYVSGMMYGEIMDGFDTDIKLEGILLI